MRYYDEVVESLLDRNRTRCDWVCDTRDSRRVSRSMWWKWSDFSSLHSRKLIEGCFPEFHVGIVSREVHRGNHQGSAVLANITFRSVKVIIPRNIGLKLQISWIDLVGPESLIRAQFGLPGGPNRHSWSFDYSGGQGTPKSSRKSWKLIKFSSLGRQGISCTNSGLFWIDFFFLNRFGPLLHRFRASGRPEFDFWTSWLGGRGGRQDSALDSIIDSSNTINSSILLKNLGINLRDESKHGFFCQLLACSPATFLYWRLRKLCSDKNGHCVCSNWSNLTSMSLRQWLPS